MKIIDTLHGNERPISVEIEPPVLGKGLTEVFDLLDPLVDLGITHIDITYHAEQIVSYVTQHGIVVPISQRKKPGTVGIAGTIRERYQVERYKDHKDNIRKVGIQWCLEQCAALRAGGAPSLHFYAARCAPIRELLTQL